MSGARSFVARILAPFGLASVVALTGALPAPSHAAIVVRLADGTTFTASAATWHTPERLLIVFPDASDREIALRDVAKIVDDNGRDRTEEVVAGKGAVGTPPRMYQGRLGGRGFADRTRDRKPEDGEVALIPTVVVETDRDDPLTVLFAMGYPQNEVLVVFADGSSRWLASPTIRRITDASGRDRTHFVVAKNGAVGVVPRSYEGLIDSEKFEERWEVPENVETAILFGGFIAMLFTASAFVIHVNASP